MTDSYKFAIGFGAANALFSSAAYFLVENKKHEHEKNPIKLFLRLFKRPSKQADTGNHEVNGQNPEKDSTGDQEEDFPRANEDHEETNIRHGQASPGISRKPSTISSISSVTSQDVGDIKRDLYSYESEAAHRFRGRRFLLLMSLAGGIITLLITAVSFGIQSNSPARLPVIALFIILFTLAYSPGAGCIPFLYSSEVFPNEGRGKNHCIVPIR